MGIKIVTDTGLDIGLDYYLQNKDIIHIEPCFVTLEEKSVLDDFGEKIDLASFYAALRMGIVPHTSMVASSRFEEAYKKLIDEGHEIIYLGFSSKLSSVHNSAILARKNLLKIRKNAKIHIIDTLSASVGHGIAMYITVDMVRAGKSAKEIVDYIEEIKLNINHWFGVDDLMFLKSGGRISPTTAYIGSALKIKPLLTVDGGGFIVPAGKTRGRKKSIATLAEKAIKNCKTELSKYILIGHSDCLDDANELKNRIMPHFKDAIIKIVPISMTIATHVGPGTLAISFLGKERE